MAVSATLPVAAQRVIDLAGVWQLAIGETPTYTDSMRLPGSMVTNSKGDDVTAHTVWTSSTYDSSYYFNPHMQRYREAGNVKYPFFLTPGKHYVGKAWYRRTVRVPADWRRERVVLFLERPHIETTVYVNGKRVGHQLSLSTPHQYDLTSYVKAGRDNEIAICVYNGIERRGGEGLPQRHRPDTGQLERHRWAHRAAHTAAALHPHPARCHRPPGVHRGRWGAA